MINSDALIKTLEERAKELNVLYAVEELLVQHDLKFEEVMYGIIDILPTGVQYPAKCLSRIMLNDVLYQPPGFKETDWYIQADIIVQDEAAGYVGLYYIEKPSSIGENVFTDDERKLLNSIAERIGHFILHKQLKEIFREFKNKRQELVVTRKPEWQIVLEMLKKTDQNLFSVISRKMLNHMFTKGIKESHELFKKLGSNPDQEIRTERNAPSKKEVLMNSYYLGFEIFRLASNYFGDEELLDKIQKWMNEEKTHYLVKALANQNTPMAEIADAIRRYHHIHTGFESRHSPTNHGIRVALIRRFLTDQLDYINIAKQFVTVDDFYKLLNNIIFPPESHGKLGGKSAGLFLANKIIEKSAEFSETLSDVKLPKTWHITSDGLMNFMYYNNMEDVIEQKYKDIEEIRQEYPHIIQAFKNSHFPPEIMNGLSRALDDFGDSPIIVRSSSLLEDRMGSSFAGKYKSLFLANQGTKEKKLEQLMDAISEVYASTFGPDPIGYRSERGLLDFNEEMGIMIQEVVGKRVGKYFFPAFAGVAFSNNEFRWSPRISREDGLIRMVPGLGTRAVDRIGNDFPILLAPGNPDLRVNLTFQEVVGYSPKYIDVMDLETNSFETFEINTIVKEIGTDFPLLNEVFSIIHEKHLKNPVGLGINPKSDDIVVTFDNLINRTKYIEQIHMMLIELKDKLGVPVDIEFACAGKNLYLLQCRPQSEGAEAASAAIPKDISKDRIIFTANKYVSNGRIPNISYIVFVDPEKYAEKTSKKELSDVGRAVGKLNKLLPNKTFILMGPGRWGSRDEIKLGVKVTYSDINNTALLMEIAVKKESYTPDLSFGTHFFQDLVEAGIKYLPLYPDSDDAIFNKEFLTKSTNTLTRFLPEYEHIEDTLRVINVRESTGGQILRVLMNADEDLAMGYLAQAGAKVDYFDSTPSSNDIETSSDEPLQWRKRMAESMALKLDGKRFGVKGLYSLGTVFNETAGPNSDIDLLVHFDGNDEQKKELLLWFEGWNHALSLINYNKSGYIVDPILDISFIKEENAKDQKYYTDIMDPKNNASRKLKLKSHV